MPHIISLLGIEFLLGGSPQEAYGTTTTEWYYYIDGFGSFVNGPDLRELFHRHCAAKINETHVAIAGGSGSTDTYFHIYDDVEGRWKVQVIITFMLMDHCDKANTLLNIQN